MPTHAISIPSVFVAVIVSGGTITAQATHPFAPPTFSATFTLSSTIAFADVNRDGACDAILPGIFGGTMSTTLDENGNDLFANGPGPGTTWPPGAPTTPIVIGMAGGNLDDDELEDLVTVTSVGSVHFHHNLGAKQLGSIAFSPDVIVDSFLAAYPISPPFINYSIPRVQVLDVDHDGNNDVFVAGGPNDRWTGSTNPGFLCVYKGDGRGNFQPCRYSLTGGVVDAQWVDLDNDGTIDHLVVLMESGTAGAFSYELLHFVFANSTLAPVGTPQSIAPGRFTSLAMADVVGDSNNDYILAETQSSAGVMSSHVYYFQGDGQGHVDTSTWGTLWLPPNVGPVGDFICSIKVGDWNRDSHPDIAVLRGYVQAPLQPGGTAARAESEVLIAMGPDLANAGFEVIPLTGYHAFSSTHSGLFSSLPLSGEPDYLRTVDFGRDSSIDLVVPGLRPLGGNTTMIACLHNLTPPVLGDTRFEKVGEPSGGLASRPARLGFVGRPRPGNSNFACTIENVQGGSLVGLMWGPIAQANWYSAFGITFHVAPAEFGYAAIAEGTHLHDGYSEYPLPIPNVPSLLGDAGYFQFNYFDPVAEVFGGTQATGVWIGN